MRCIEIFIHGVVVVHKRLQVDYFSTSKPCLYEIYKNRNKDNKILFKKEFLLADGKTH